MSLARNVWSGKVGHDYLTLPGLYLHFGKVVSDAVIFVSSLLVRPLFEIALCPNSPVLWLLHHLSYTRILPLFAT